MLAFNSRQLSLLLFVVCLNHICSCYAAHSTIGGLPFRWRVADKNALINPGACCRPSSFKIRSFAHRLNYQARAYWGVVSPTLHLSVLVQEKEIKLCEWQCLNGQIDLSYGLILLPSWRIDAALVTTRDPIWLEFGTTVQIELIYGQVTRMTDPLSPRGFQHMVTIMAIMFP